MTETTRVVVEEVAPESREIVVSGRKLLRGRTLGSFLQEFGGYEGTVQEPLTQRQFDITLERWRGRDPEATWLAIAFITEESEAP